MAPTKRAAEASPAGEPRKRPGESQQRIDQNPQIKVTKNLRSERIRSEAKPPTKTWDAKPAEQVRSNRDAQLSPPWCVLFRSTELTQYRTSESLNVRSHLQKPSVKKRAASPLEERELADGTICSFQVTRHKRCA